MRTKRRALSALGTLVLLGMISGVSLANSGGSPKLAWEKIVEEEGYEYEFKAAVLLEDGVLGLVVQARPVGTTHSSESFVPSLVRVTLEGRIVERLQLGDLVAGKLSSLVEIKDLRRMPNRELVALISMADGSPAVLKLDGSGQELRSSMAPVTGSGTSFEALVPLDESSLALLGRQAEDFLLVKVDANGKVLWRNTVDRGGMEALFDGVARGRDVLVVGDSGNFDMLGRGPSKVWIAKYGADGKLLMERTIPGRRGRLAASSDGQVVIVYDQSETDEQHVWLEALGDDLKSLWKAKILDAASGYSTYEVAAGNSGDWIVAGAREDKPYVVSIDKRGKRQWDFWGKDLRSADDYGVVSAQGQVYVASSVFAPSAGGALLQRARILKLVP